MSESSKISEWNEGNFKSLRLHQIQMSLNLLKMNPTGITEGKFNFEHIINLTKALYTEGCSKYSDSEVKEMDKIKEKIDKFYEICPPQKKIIMSGFYKDEVKYCFDDMNLKMLLDLLDFFEKKARGYNDDHGLGTKNRTSNGLF